MPAPFGRASQGDGRNNDGPDAGFGLTGSQQTARSAETGPSDNTVPTPSLPKGGGAMRGLGEQFQMAAFTGTGSLTIPVNTSPGRGGFGPQISLRYDSGAGNGPFGLGMSLSPPSISRRTDRGLPWYGDRDDSDDFQLTGAEDLVPVLVETASGWEKYERTEGDFLVHRYRPRVESAFARIERWRNTVTRRTHWRVTDRSNVTSYFGQTAGSCIGIPPQQSLVFKWLLDRVEDDRGNVAVYEYVQENDDNAPRWPEQAVHPGPLPQRYLKRIRYGNRTPFDDGQALNDDQWMFEVVFDYGDHGETMPGPSEAVVELLAVPHESDRPWAMRQDPFSTRRPWFDLRTRRLCRRVLMFHRFEALGPEPVLVASTDFTYAPSPVATLLTAVSHRGYVRQPNGTYRAEAGPPLSLEYTPGTLSRRFGEVDADSLHDVSPALDGSTLRLVDLDGEGSPGLLTRHDRTWRYKRSRGGGRFAPAAPLPTMPTTVGSAAVQLSDFDGAGHLSLWSPGPPAAGAFARTDDGDWGPFRAFDRVPIGWNPNAATFVDLTGDGLPDLVVPHVDNQLTWWRSKGREGYDHPASMSQPRSMPIPDPRRPTDNTLVTMADMTGDGLADVVRIANGQLSYWPNRGRGQFGDEVIMTGLEPFDHPDRMRGDRIRLADVDGTGTADLIYFDDQGARVWINGAGNGFMPPVRVRGLPPAHSLAHVDVLDIEGTGVGSLVWSSSGSDRAIRYVSVFETKPYILSRVTNGRGLETTYTYAPSTKFYREDHDAGRPWVTRLPFPVQVVERVETVDNVTGHRTVSRYAYHHGYYDGAEREFRGFGLVEQWDAESFEDGAQSTLDVPPVHTKTWFHTGAYLGRQRISTALSAEYWTGDADAVELADTVLPSGLRPEEAREAVRALKGTMLRQEVFAEDGSDVADVPYTVAERNFAVRMEQPRAGQRHGSFLVHEREALSYHYERDASDPRVQHTATLEVDAYGSVTRSVAVGYPRRTPAHGEQGQTAVVVSEADVAHQAGDDGPFRLGVPIEARTFELTGQVGDPTQPWSWQQLVEAIDAAPEVPHETDVAPGQQVRRLLTRQRSFYYADDLTTAAPLGDPGARALPYEARGAAFSEAHVAMVYGTNVDATMLTEAGYVLDEGLWWTTSFRQVFDASLFYQPTSVIDPWGNTSTITYDADGLLVTEVIDPVGNAVEAGHDYRVLAPTLVTDANGNRTAAAYDGMGQLHRTAVLGKVGDTVDTLETPTTELTSDLWGWHDHSSPVWMRTRAREHHGIDPGRWLDTYAYVDGRGGALMTKAPAQPGTEVYDQTLPEPVSRWVGSGRTIRNNKGLPVRQYEPFFSTTEAFEDEEELVQHGVSPVMHYDPLGRVIRTELPDGTQARVEFSPWVQRSFDANDTVVGTTWHTERMALPAHDPHRRAAQLAEAHADTPSVAHLDHLGRPFLGIDHNRDSSGADVFSETRSTLDIQGNVLRITDALGTVAEQLTHAMLGQTLHTSSAEVGQRWGLADVLGNPHWGTTSRGFSTRTHYDPARRPVRTVVTRPDGGSFTSTRIVYGETAANANALNLRGRIYRTYDGAGMLEHESFDIDGNLARQSRQVAAAYDITPDWSALDGIDDPVAMEAVTAALLDAEIFTTEATFDALGRPVTQTAPDTSVIHFGYGDAGPLESVAANVRGAPSPTPFVDDLRYNARGQRTLVAYGNGTRTTYAHDPQTFRLTQLRTERISNGHLHQDLQYTYDPVGNLAEIDDGAQPVVFANNAAVSASQRFGYDALYRLVHAEGREHQSLGQPTADDFVPRVSPDDPTALRPYTEQHLYDAVGNILEMQHAAVGGSWTRRYNYGDHSQGHRLQATSAPGDADGIFGHTYSHDAHGNMTAMPHLAAIDWDHADRMHSADLGGGGEVFFQYDATAQRVRKVRRNLAGTSTWERIYVGGYEVYRERVGQNLRLERQTLHIADDSGRICLVETKTVDNDAPVANPTTIERYQYGNHLGSVGLELDETAQLISYEEFHPYGTSAYRAANSAIDVNPSRYRYTGQERDEETGLGYHGARYYASWLGRWTAADPIGLGDGPNRYRYARNRPSNLNDPSGLLPPDGPQVDRFLYRNHPELAEKVAPPLPERPPPLFPPSGSGTVGQERNNTDVRGNPHEATPTGPTSGRPIDPLYPAFEGAIGQAYDQRVAAFSDPRRGFVERGQALVGATVLAPFHLLEEGGEVILNAPRNAHLALEHTDRAFEQKDPLNTADDLAIAAGHTAEVAAAGLAIAEPVALRPKSVADDAAGGRVFKGPGDRHFPKRVQQGKTRTKAQNTVIEPGVDVAGDVAAINAGLAKNVGENLVVNGRTYGVHPDTGRLFPISGPGFHQLNRGAHKALGIFNKFGETPKAHEILGKMHDVGEAEARQALDIWRLSQ